MNDQIKEMIPKKTPLLYRKIAERDIFIEELALVLHESGREAVEKRAVLVKDDKFKKFVEWDELPEDAKEGRRIQARFLDKYFYIHAKGWVLQ